MQQLTVKFLLLIDLLSGTSVKLYLHTIFIINARHAASSV